MHGAWEGGYVPCTAFSHREWLADITHWRAERRIRIGYDPARYEMPALQWAQRSFMQPQMMVHDRYFYNTFANKYTVDKYLDDLDTRYGGIDAVLIWATYPNMGIDDRNQHDMVRSMPGGIELTNTLASRASVIIKLIGRNSDSARTCEITRLRRRWPKPTIPGE